MKQEDVQQIDEEMRAWVMLHAMSATKPGLFGKKKAEKELRAHLQALGVNITAKEDAVPSTGSGIASDRGSGTLSGPADDEQCQGVKSDRGSGTLSGSAGDTSCQTTKPDSVPDTLSDFPARYIRLCLTSRSYGSTLMNLIPLNETSVHEKLRKEILQVTQEYPALFGLDKECIPLRDAMLEELERQTE